MQEGYRYDVQGLRAIAVLLVLLFHVDLPMVPGGFIGVDIFFVISGFVIFKGLGRDLAESQLSIARFYRRRIFRIVPALIATIVLTLLYGCYILGPDELIALSESALAASVAVSNIYFHDRAGYFADAAYNLPLLHTWSLGVEEQFYLLAPALFMLVARRAGIRAFGWVLVGLSLLSFGYNLYLIFDRGAETSAFYMPMSRFWEIGVGGIIAILFTGFRPTHRLSMLLAASGLVGIVMGATLIDDRTLFPAFAALLPVGGTALVILARLSQSNILTRVLTAPPLLFLGKISYSTYLVHWPVVVFYKMQVGRALNALEMGGLLVAVILLAFLSWRFVETTFQRERAEAAVRGRGRMLLSSWAGAAAVAAFLVFSGGLPARLTPEAARAVDIIAANQRNYRPCTPVDQLNGQARSRDNDICSFSGGGERLHYVLWGDSHADVLSEPLSDALQAEGLHGLVSVLSNCPSLAGVFTKKRENRERCLNLAKHLTDLVEKQDIPVVILANRWANLASPLRAPGDGSRPWSLYDAEAGGRPIDFAEALTRTIDRLENAGASIVIVGPVPESYFDVPDMLVRTLNRGAVMPVLARGDVEQRQTIVLNVLQELERRPSVSIVYPHRALCDQEFCHLVDGDVPLYTDDDHLNLSGVSRVIPPITSEILARTVVGNTD